MYLGVNVKDSEVRFGVDNIGIIRIKVIIVVKVMNEII